MSSFPTNCKNCNAPFHWGKNIPRPNDPSKFGWWVEDLTNFPHYKNRCEAFQKSKEFFSNPQSPSSSPTPEKVISKTTEGYNKLEVSDFAEKPMREEIKIHLKFFDIIEDEVIKHLGKDANPAKIGMVIKFVQEELQRKSQ